MPYGEPIVLSIVLCDQVIEDKRTNKKSLIGVFNDIITGRLPTKHPCMYLVISLTNCLGNNEFEINLTRDTDYGDHPILQMKGRFEAQTPLDVIDLVFELRDVPLTHTGKHTIEILSQPNAHRIAQRFFYVKKFGNPAQPKPENPPPIP